MKLLLFIPFLILSLAACNNEKRITKNALKNQQMVRETAMYFITKYSHSGLGQVYLSINDSVDEKYMHFLKKLHTPYIQVNYDSKVGFIDADSVVLFTKDGVPIIGTEHDIMYDFKSEPRNSFHKDGNFEKCYRISDRTFYIQAPMPEF